MALRDYFKTKKKVPVAANEDLPDLSAQALPPADSAQQVNVHMRTDTRTHTYTQANTLGAREQTTTAAENEGLPSVNRRSSNNHLLFLMGASCVVVTGAALLVAANHERSQNKIKPASPPERIANNLPPIVVPPTPAPIAVSTTTMGPAASQGNRPGLVPALQPGTQPIPVQTNGKPPPDWTERKMGGSLLVDARSLPSNLQGSGALARPVTGPEGTDAARTGMDSRPAPATQNELATKLEPTLTKSVAAALLPDRQFLLTKGTTLDCALETALDSSVPGMATCRLTRDIYSDNGQVLLLDRGSQLVGEYQGGMRQGQTRLFVLWTRAKTPQGVTVNLNSPGTDALGRSGLDGWVDQHFAERFGAAILFSLMKDTLAMAAARQQSAGNTIVFGNTQAAGEQLVGKVLDATINIPPTLVKNQGDHIQIMVARDLDFSGVYGLRIKSEGRSHAED